MTRAIAHRGPDGEGLFLRNGVALGHRRLSIIDIERGAQPMTNEDQSVWITFNGEIYNYRELTTELISLGHRFVTRSDTEAIVHAYDEWGADCVKRLRGMFAFAIADFNNRRLLLARDHFGIKPLYYRRGEGFTAFASELLSLRQVNAPSPVVSLEAIEYFLRFQYIPIPLTIYHDTRKLPPASYVIADFDGNVGEPVRYWDVEFDGARELESEGLEEATHRVIRDSVEAHLVADVPFGVFLSGGVDSTIVAMEMSRILGTSVRAFGIGFDEQAYSEMGFAREAARRSGVELIIDVVREDEAIEILPELVAHYGEPFGDTSAIPTWFVSRLARAHVPMVLSGDGGDEAFGGYDSYRTWMKLPRTSTALEQIRGGHPRGAARTLVGALRRAASGATLAGDWQRNITYFDAGSRARLWREDLRHLTTLESARFAEAAARAASLDHLSFAQYMDYQTYLPSDILTKVDVASMSHGLEVRTPLIDRLVVEHAARIPVEYRYRRNDDGQLTGKYLLKKILSRDFSSSFVYRKKMGFALPRSHWFMPGRPFRELAEEVTLSSGAILGDIFDHSELQHQFAVHSEKRDNSGNLWLLLVLGLWLEQQRGIEISQTGGG